jgi:hypothetical protein
MADVSASALSRRHFLTVAAGATAAAAIPIGVGTASAAGGSTPKLPELGQFASAIGTSFRVRVAPAQWATITLQTVEETPGTNMRGDWVSLVFAGSRRDPFAAGTYTVTHPTLGRRQLFLVPIGRDASLQRYEAVIHRLGG